MQQQLFLFMLTLFKLTQSLESESLESEIESESLDCEFRSSYPRHIVTHKLQEKEEIKIDGKLDEDAWTVIQWSDDFQDISTDVIPRFRTRMKLRWDDDWLYIAAELEEPEIWANISETCHCINDDQDQVIFHDNDFEVFIDVDGSNHHYKEFEINAENQTWILMLDKPYSDGGVENSSRVFGQDGYDMQPPLSCGVKINPENALNNPTVKGNHWTVEVGMPISKILEATLHPNKSPKHGDYWRINFSRVQWRVLVENEIYVKDPKYPHEDNWVWNPIGEIAMHLPERWGFLQFSTEAPNKTEIIVDEEEWTLRQVIMSLYYAQHNYADENQGLFTDDIFSLAEFITYPSQNLDEGILLGQCTNVPDIILSNGAKNFEASVSSFSGLLEARITDDRFLSINRNLQPMIEII